MARKERAEVAGVAPSIDPFEALVQKAQGDVLAARAVYGGSNGGDVDGQPVATWADGNPPFEVDAPGTDREGSRSRGPGSDAVYQGILTALQRGRAQIQRYDIHVRSETARLMAGLALRQRVTEFAPGPDGQPVAVVTYTPSVVPGPPSGLNPSVWQSVWRKVQAVTRIFHEMTGRWPQVGGAGQTADDVEYQRAVSALLG